MKLTRSHPLEHTAAQEARACHGRIHIAAPPPRAPLGRTTHVLWRGGAVPDCAGAGGATRIGGEAAASGAAPGCCSCCWCAAEAAMRASCAGS